MFINYSDCQNTGKEKKNNPGIHANSQGLTQHSEKFWKYYFSTGRGGLVLSN